MKWLTAKYVAFCQSFLEGDWVEEEARMVLNQREED